MGESLGPSAKCLWFCEHCAVDACLDFINSAKFWCSLRHFFFSL